MSANLFTESHLREFLEQGFEVTIVREETAAVIPDAGLDGYNAALTNFRMMANHLFSTKEVINFKR